MERNNLLNLLYVERQRLSEQNNQIGWSIWILIGGIITLSWMLLEHYEIAIQSSAFGFSWSQVVTLFGDFITIAFALLLIKNYYSDRKTDYRSDRFEKSKLPLFIILDGIIAISLYVYHCFFSNGMIASILTFAIVSYLTVKSVELYQLLKYKQQMPLLFKQFVYLSASAIVLITSICRISTHYNYDIVNTKYALLSCGIIIVSYVLFWHIWNPIKKSVISIDKLINNMIVNENINTELVYNEFITVKIGYKYSQLYNNGFHEIKNLLVKQEYYITLLRKNIDELEASQGVDTETLNRSMKLFNKFQKENEISYKLTQKLLTKIQRDWGYIAFNKENKLEIEKLLDAVKSNINAINVNCDTISELLDRFKEIINKQRKEYSSCANYCRFANNRFLCYSHRILHYLKKQSSVDNCSNK